MTDFTAVAALTINDRTVSLYDLLHGLKVKGSLGFLEEAVTDHLLAEAAAREGIKISDGELQEAVNRFRQRAGLESASGTAVWLEENRLTVDDLADRLERQLTHEKLKQKVTQGQEKRYFENNRESFETAIVGQVLFEDETTANKFLERVKGDSAGFYALARSHSEDFSSRFPLCVRRDALPPAIEAAVFGAAAGDVIGPIKTDNGHYVIKVEEILPVAWTEDLNSRIRDILFNDWRKDLVRSAKIGITLKEVI